MINFDPDRRVWEQVHETLIQRIEAGVYKERNPIPSIVHLQQEFGVALGTIRKVVRKLADEGYVNPIPGRATYVLPRDRWPAGE
ncbi:hypothetical protein Sme01_02500 [Sphaerisporangium melleum]|uniref:HTH gntR-type domain-containing protein n=1 Tax=Sphaerisporangium melleum TaxID=321316 RepID=A0A917VBB8_9ACTN|nr:winged helix-turn-helix domain-containing protein [Sphaerisporangium melleum]GGK60945.1 hypothetical protein GCM10007964_00040 [Sphaerisporangium melleum]GII67774.1 hypothetical protein Sme01_02500 [Sphaerisporangium melleum]